MTRLLYLTAGVTGSIVADRLGIWWPATICLAGVLTLLTLLSLRS